MYYKQMLIEQRKGSTRKKEHNDPKLLAIHHYPVHHPQLDLSESATPQPNTSVQISCLSPFVAAGCSHHLHAISHSFSPNILSPLFSVRPLSALLQAILHPLSISRPLSTTCWPLSHQVPNKLNSHPDTAPFPFVAVDCSQHLHTISSPPPPTS